MDELTTATQRGADEEWHGLSVRFRAPLTAYFRRRINDRIEAEDLVQEVFVRLFRYPNRQSGKNLGTYVFTIASSVLTDWARQYISRKKKAHHQLPDTQQKFDIPPALIEDRSPERVLIATDTLQNLEEALSELSERTRDIFVLSRLQGISHSAIAASCGISISAVEKHVVKAVAHLEAHQGRL